MQKTKVVILVKDIRDMDNVIAGIETFSGASQLVKRDKVLVYGMDSKSVPHVRKHLEYVYGVFTVFTEGEYEDRGE